MKYLLKALTFAVTFFAGLSIQAETCSLIARNNVVSGDAALTPVTCNQTYIDFYWYQYRFDQKDWDEGFGWEAPCDITRPLSRTFNALHVLQYSSPNPTTNTGQMDGNILRWGANYANAKIDELDGRCGSGGLTGVVALTAPSTTYKDPFTQLHWPFFFGENVVDRAAVVVHEARHADKVKSHVTCPNGTSIGCDPDWAFAGGYQFQVLWLWWFRVEGAGWTSTMSQQAKDEANTLLSTKFVTNPNIFIN